MGSPHPRTAVGTAADLTLLHGVGLFLAGAVAAALVTGHHLTERHLLLGQEPQEVQQVVVRRGPNRRWPEVPCRQLSQDAIGQLLHITVDVGRHVGAHLALHA